MAVQKIKSGSYVKIQESKGKYRETYFGFLTHTDKDGFVSVCADIEERNRIAIKSFAADSYICSEIKKDQVDKLFEIVKINIQKKIDEFEFDLLDAKETMRATDIYLSM